MTAPSPAPERARVQRATPRPDLYVVEASRRSSRTGDPGSYRRPRTTPIVVVAVVIVFGALMASAMFHSVLVTGQAQLDDLHQQTRVQTDQLQRDQLRLATYRSPARIASEAHRLGLVPADRQTWIDPGQADAPVTTGSVDGTASELAAGLKVTPGSAALQMQRTYTTSDGEVAQVTVNTHPSGRFRHAMTMRRVKG